MKKLATLLVVTLALTFSVFAPTHPGYAKTDIVNMVKEQMAQAGIHVESVKVVGHSNYLTTYNNKATPVQTLTIQIKQHASFEDMLKGSETIEQYLLYLALDNGLTIEESQKMRTPADLLYWLKAHNVDIRKGYSWTWGTDVAIVNNTLMNVYEDGTMLPFKTIIEKKPNDSISKENTKFLANYTSWNRYNPYSAITYAEKYSRETGDLRGCREYYNSSYKCFEYNDCANFVSQAIYAGNIPLDSTWKPYTPAWVNVGEFSNHFLNYLQYTSYSYASAGDIAKTSSHIVLVTRVQNGTVYYTAHTRDRLNHPMYPGYFNIYKLIYPW